ncbi:hypothetical protein MLD38_021482 [Melastoma candidum]|uniref:Uncharacterized protein n=1 Tax=Melastoma candidum TaxID=119954 RepID=A0ACB9QI24_9MYRT|nr:hypothetical protein MLD38_021482 [Melastoma candidum]
MINSPLFTRPSLRKCVFLTLRVRRVHAAAPTSGFGRRQDEESRNVRVSVWWDFENCNIPAGVNVYRIGQSIINAVRCNGIKGPVQITAYGDVLQLSRTKQEALSSSGINMTHVPNGGKNSADRLLLVDLMCWVSQNPPPAHLFLISGDRDFAGILHRLRMNNYNVLLASPESASGVLCSAASIMWHWNSLVRGENLAGRIYNQPPDGPYGSWYGHYKVSTKDPYAGIESSSSKSENIRESCPEQKPATAPASVVKRIRRILSSFPQGISITELRLELDRQSVNLDRNFYGHKKFPKFLLSMPQVLKLHRDDGGQYIIHPINQRPIEAIDPEPTTPTELSTDIRETEVYAPCKLSQQVIDSRHGASVTHATVPAETNIKVVEELPGKANVKHPTDERAVDKADIAVDQALLTPVASQGQQSASEAGVFRRVWNKWFGPRPDNAAKDDCISLSDDTGMEKHRVSHDEESPPLSNPGRSGGNNSRNNTSPSPAALPAFDNFQSYPDETIAKSQKCGDEVSTGPRPNIFRRFANWCRFQRNDGLDNSNKLVTPSVVVPAAKFDHIVSSEAFWSDMKSFLGTSRGSAIICQCRNREDLAQQLQKAGPADLMSLRQDELLHLTGVLISERKLIREDPSLKFPFMLTKSCSHSPRGLSSFFRSEGSPTRRALENDVAKKHKSIAHTGVSAPIQSENPPDRSTRRTLDDCQVLVKDILQRDTGRYYIGSFREEFFDRYGYALDLQSLGYQNLSSLLEDMPGVTVRSPFLFPTKKASEYGEKGQESDASCPLPGQVVDLPSLCMKYEEADSTWEELGPVMKTSITNVEHQAPFGTKSSEQGTKFEYEAVLSEDDLSDSEDEFTSSRHCGRTQKADQDDSSLLQILDSWYKKEESNDGGKVGTTNDEGKGDSTSSDSEPSIMSHVLSEETTIQPHLGRKQKRGRAISFVAESDENRKDKLIDGILGSLKRSGEAGMQG